MEKEVKSALLKYIGYFVIILFQGTSFAVLWYNYYIPLMVERNREFYFWGNIAIVAFYLLFIVTFTKSFDGYKFAVLRTKSTYLSNVLGIICGNFVGNILLWAVGRYYFSVVPMLMLTVLQGIFTLLIIVIMRWINVKVLHVERILLIYGKYSPDALLEKVSKIENKIQVKKMLSIKEDIKVIQDEILNHESVLVYDLESDSRNQVIKFCYVHKKKIYITPKLTDIIIGGAEELPFFDTPLLRVKERGLSAEAQVIKRVFDIVFSILAIVVTLPFMLVFAVIIKIQDGGRIFYTQERLTKEGQQFKMIKFRSMREDAEKDGVQLAKHEDERVTLIGKFMRATHIDELPQIFNVLLGEMSLVGPRPERREIAEKYQEKTPEFNYRLSVKAGLTGYAQIYGKYNTTPYDKLRLDLNYIENYSIGLDIKLLFMTLKVVFQKENSEGIKKNQETAMRDMSGK